MLSMALGHALSCVLQAVDIKMVQDVPAAVSATVEPANVDDWEVVESNAEYLTDQMLNQACLLSAARLFCAEI